MTVQACEKIIYEGGERKMPTTPDLPKDQYIVNNIGMGLPNSGCWRGYIGTWEINGNALYLLSLKGKYLMKSNHPVFASWYTGDLVLPEGKPVKYSIGGIAVYENEIVISIVCGHVVKKKYCRRDVDSMHNKSQENEERLFRILKPQKKEKWLFRILRRFF